LRASFAKEGDARFFGHLEMVNIFVRALRRAAIPVQHSQGFHPMPKIAFSDPLPIGLESLCETFNLSVDASVCPDDLVQKLNDQLPAGLRILACEPAQAGKKGQAGEPHIDCYQAVPPLDVALDPDLIQTFWDQDEWIVTKTNRKGKLKKMNLKDIIQKMHLDDAGTLLLSLGAAPGQTFRPSGILREIFSLDEETIQRFRMVKIDTTE
jgi:radical SAM-linked protein